MAASPAASIEKGKRMQKPIRILTVISALLTMGSTAEGQVESADVRSQVAEVERAFAKTMADRDYAAFTSFLSEEAVFLAGTTVRHGKQPIATHWKTYFDESDAPFSWEPETVSVLESGTLAISTGPVWNAQGRRTSTYTSIWRQEAPGVWRIIFDKGDSYCE